MKQDIIRIHGGLTYDQDKPNPDREELRREYPEIEDEDILQALLYAAAHVDDRVFDLPISHETAA